MSAEPLYIFPNLEMGDNIVLNGLARHFAATEEKVVWVTKAAYHEPIRRMFTDVGNLEVIDGYDYPEIRENLIPKAMRKVRMGFFGPEGTDWHTVQWDKAFYDQAGVDFEVRWEKFLLSFDLYNCAYEADKLQKRYPLIHDIPERGLSIDPEKIPPGNSLRILKSASFWDWLEPVCMAAELHFIDSAYLNLAESLYALGFLRDTKLVFHRYVKVAKHNSVPPVLRAPWVILD